VWNKLKTRLMPKWKTTVVDPRNLEADNKRVWLLPQGGYKQLPQVVTKTLKTQRQVPNSHRLTSSMGIVASRQL